MKLRNAIALPLAAAMVAGLMAVPSPAQQRPGAPGRDRDSRPTRIAENQAPSRDVLAAPSRESRRSRSMVDGGVIAGATTNINTCFEAVDGYAPGTIDGQNGWITFPAANPSANIDTTAAPEGAQYLRNAFLASVAQGAAQGAESPDFGITGPGRGTVSYRMNIGATGGADYFVDAVSLTDGLVLAQVRFRFNDTTLDPDTIPGDILVVDEVPPGSGTLAYVGTGVNYTPGVTHNLRMEIDADRDRVRYYFDNVLVYTGVALAPASGLEAVDFYSDNFQVSEVAKFDCLTVETAIGSCPADIAANNAVDVDDLIAVILGWGTPAGDVDGNGTTDVDDLIAVILGWGPCAVPTGACCTGGACSTATYLDCVNGGGIYQGNDVNCVDVTCPTANDECTGAQVINVTPGSPFTETRSETEFTTNPNDPDTSCELAGGGPFIKAGGWWYQWTAPAGVTTLRVETCTSATNNDSVVSMYTGVCGALVEHGCDDDICAVTPPFGLSRMNAAVTPGTTYLIFIDHYQYTGANPGPTTVTITANPSP